MIPAIDLMETGRNIVKLRKAAGLSVRELQEIFGFSTPQAIYKWQHGVALPSIDNLVVLAMVLDVSMDEIIVLSRGSSSKESASDRLMDQRKCENAYADCSNHEIEYSIGKSA